MIGGLNLSILESAKTEVAIMKKRIVRTLIPEISILLLEDMIVPEVRIFALESSRRMNITRTAATAAKAISAYSNLLIANFIAYPFYI